MQYTHGYPAPVIWDEFVLQIVRELSSERHRKRPNSDRPASIVTRNKPKLQESPRVMNLAAIKCSFAESFAPVRSVDSQIRAFLAGKGEGEELLHSIYDHVLDEPVPERLTALLKP